MTEFLQPTGIITENGEIVDEYNSPIMEIKKLNGQGTLYKLTDADLESISAHRERTSSINVDKLIRSVRSNFGTGDYIAGAIFHIPLPFEMSEIGMIRVEVNSKVSIDEAQHKFDKITNHDLFMYIEDQAVFTLNSWYEFVKKAHVDGEVNDEFLEMCTMIVDDTSSQASESLNDTMFEKYIPKYDKITIVRERVYD